MFSKQQKKLLSYKINQNRNSTSKKRKGSHIHKKFQTKQKCLTTTTRLQQTLLPLLHQRPPQQQQLEETFRGSTYRAHSLRFAATESQQSHANQGATKRSCWTAAGRSSRESLRPEEAKGVLFRRRTRTALDRIRENENWSFVFRVTKKSLQVKEKQSGDQQFERSWKRNEHAILLSLSSKFSPHRKLSFFLKQRTEKKNSERKSKEKDQMERTGKKITVNSIKRIPLIKQNTTHQKLKTTGFKRGKENIIKSGGNSLCFCLFLRFFFRIRCVFQFYQVG